MISNETGGKGRFIVFEGIDGSGKTTQLRKLTQRLSDFGVSCYQTKEPTDGAIGSLLRQFLTGNVKTDDRAIALLFAADRLDHLLNDTNGIVDIINKGISVVSDRYYISSYAYHSVSMPMEWVMGLNSLSAEVLKPTCSIFIDVEPGVALSRIGNRSAPAELYENLERLTAVRKNYFEAFRRLEGFESVIVVDGDTDESSLSDIIWGKISHLFIGGGSLH